MLWIIIKKRRCSLRKGANMRKVQQSRKSWSLFDILLDRFTTLMTGNYKFAPAVVIFFARGSSVLIWFRGYGNYFLRIAPIPPLNGINMALASFLFNCCELKWGEVRWGGEWSAAPHMWAYLFWFDPLGPERWWFSNGLEYLQSFSFLNKRFNWLFMSFFIVFYCKKHSQGGGNTRN